MNDDTRLDCSDMDRDTDGRLRRHCDALSQENRRLRNLLRKMASFENGTHPSPVWFARQARAALEGWPHAG